MLETELLQIAKKKFVPVKRVQPEYGIEVLGFSKEWIDEDFNPDGTRVCFMTDGSDTKWHSAKYCNHQDTYCDNFDPPQYWRYLPKYSDQVAVQTSDQNVEELRAIQTGLLSGTALQAELIWTALHSIKVNPELTIKEAIVNALVDWDEIG